MIGKCAGCAVAAWAMVAFQAVGAVTYMENSRLKVGVETSGGVLTYFENKLDDDASVANMIASSVQPCFRVSNGGLTLLPSGNDATSSLSADGKTLTCSCSMANAANGAKVASTLEMTYVLHADHLEVRGSFTDKVGQSFAESHNEVPAFYALKKLSTFTCYLGASAWTGGGLTEKKTPPFWGGNGDAYLNPQSAETWGAWTSPTSGKGVGVYREGANCLLMGQDGGSSYVAPLAICALPKKGTYSFAYYLAAGDVATMRDIFAGIRFGTSEGGYLGKGRVKIAADSPGGLRFTSLDPASGRLKMAAKIVAANGTKTSDEFVLVCRTDLADPATEFTVPAQVSVAASGENAAGTLQAEFPDLPSLFVMGVGTPTPTIVKQYEEAGFPTSYATRLAALHELHPAWQFEPLIVSDMSWTQVIDRECQPKVNLVTYSSWAPSPWNTLGYANYSPYYAENAQAYDSGSWYQASRAAIEYFMDPRNFMNDTEVFMFETLGYDGNSQTQDAVERALSGSFMANARHDGGSEKYSALLVRMGAKYGISPVFLAGRVKSEQGNGTVQSSGTIGTSLMELYNDADGKVGSSNVWGTNYTKDNAATANVIAKGAAYYNGYYNFFNMGAAGTGLFEIRYNAWKEAFDASPKWTTQELAIEGGTVKMRDNYIASLRHTRYFQKFSVCPQSSKRWQQYMQNIAAPLTEARSTREAYVAAGVLEKPYRFIVPVYVGMPAAPCPDPANGNSYYSATK